MKNYRVFLNYEVMETLRRLRIPDRIMVGWFIFWTGCGVGFGRIGR